MIQRNNPMKKLNIELEAVVVLAVRTKIRLLVCVSDHDQMRRIVKDFAQGKFRTTSGEILGIEIVDDHFEDGIDGDDSLKRHVLDALKDGNTITIISSSVSE